MTNHHDTAPIHRGFTILELLVATSVLAVLVVLVAQMLGSASTMASGGRKRMAADEEARMVFDRMAADIARMVKRGDVDSLFVGRDVNDEMYFYSEAPATYTNTAGNSPLALVGYRVETNCLVRVSEGKNWDGITFLTVGTNGVTDAASRINTNSLTNSVVIAPSVFRMEYTFLMKPGTTNAAGATNGANTFSKASAPGSGLKDISAIVVSLALIDEASRKIVDAAAVSDMASKFQDTTNQPAFAAWTTAVTNALTGPARASTRIYQRYIPVCP